MLQEAFNRKVFYLFESIGRDKVIGLMLHMSLNKIEMPCNGTVIVRPNQRALDALQSLFRANFCIAPIDKDFRPYFGSFFQGFDFV